MHSTESSTTSLRLDQVAAAVRRRWLAALVVLLGWLVIGALAAHVVPAAYSATAAVTVESFDTASLPTASSVDMPTEVQAAASGAVVDIVARRLEEDAAEVRKAITVSNPQGSRVLEISYRAKSPSAAAAGANSVASAYLAVRKRQMQAQARTMSAAIEQSIKDLPYPHASSADAQGVLASAYAQQLAALKSQLADLRLRSDATGGAVTTSATPPSGPSGPSQWAYLAGALVLGATCAAAVALLRDRFSQRTVDASLLSQQVDAPVISGALHSSALDVTRTLALRLGLADLQAPSTLAVVSTPASGLAQELTAHLRRQGALVQYVDPRAVGARAVDQGWPRRAYPDSGLVVIDVAEAVDTPLAATIASRSEVVILSVTQGARLRPLRRFLTLLRASGRSADAAVLLHRRHGLSAPYASRRDPEPASATESSVP